MTTQDIAPGDLVLLAGSDNKELIVKVESGHEIQTHRGVLPHDHIIGQPWGATVKTHRGYEYMLLPPSLEQQIRTVRRSTQIVYPKEIGYLIVKMNIGPGIRIIEAGTGSGGMTLALARMVQPNGHVFSYEIRPEMQHLAQRNLDNVGLSEHVTFKIRDIAEGFDETGVDAVFLDVREPWLYLKQVHRALKGGGFLGSLVPTTNQIVALLRTFENYPFGFVEVEELLLRPYKAVHGRLRPFDRMVAHTGYLVFARALSGPVRELPLDAVPDSDEASFHEASSE